MLLDEHGIFWGNRANTVVIIQEPLGRSVILGDPQHVWTSCSKVVGALPKVSHIDVRVCSPWSQKGIHVCDRNEVLRVQEGLEVWAFSAESEKVCRFQKKVRPYFLVENLIIQYKYRNKVPVEYRFYRVPAVKVPKLGKSIIPICYRTSSKFTICNI